MVQEVCAEDGCLDVSDQELPGETAAPQLNGSLKAPMCDNSGPIGSIELGTAWGEGNTYWHLRARQDTHLSSGVYHVGGAAA